MRISALWTGRQASPRRGRLVTAVAAATAVGLSGTPATAATARLPAEDGSQGLYLALGDSVAFGYRPPAVTPPEAYANPRNFTSYANYTAKATRLRLVNASCPGETSGSMISTTAPDLGCRFYRTIAPLHQQYTGTQLQYAVRFLRAHPDTRLVTINVGANDAFLCQATPGCQVDAAAAAAAANLSTVLRRLRTAGHYRGTIVTLTYYYTPTFPISLAQRLNVLLAAASRSHGAVVANGLAAFRSAARRSGGDPCLARLLIALPTGGCDRHPSPAGQLVLAVPVTLAYVHSQQPARKQAA